MTSQPRVELSGSHKDPLPDARPAGPVDPKELADVTVRLRAKPGSDVDRDLSALLAKPPAQRKFLSTEEFERTYGAADDDFDKVEEFGAEHRLSVVSRDAAHRVVVLRGTLAALESAFGTRLELFHHQNGSFRGRSGSLSIPAN